MFFLWLTIVDCSFGAVLVNCLRIKSVNVHAGRLEVKFECKGAIRNYFVTDKFYVEYKGEDIEQVPEHILNIPFLATVAPLTWANQAILQVETIDENFLKSLQKACVALQRFYPKMTFTNNLIADKIVPQEKPGVNSKAMVLFSGGIDSLATFIRHKTEKPIIVTVHGPDILTTDYSAWTEKIRGFPEFAEANCTRFRIVRSNFYEMLERVILRSYNKKLDGDWYVKVMFGLSLLGLCSPLTYVHNVDRLYIASSYDVYYNEPCGSTPEVDNNISWGNTRCIHDGFELTRQQKIQKIAEYVKENKINLPIKVCLEQKGYNCSSSKCHKCVWTISGLIVAGLNPNDHQFNVDSKTLIEIKDSLMNGMYFADRRRYWWREIQTVAKQIENSVDLEFEEYVEWLKNVQIEKLGAKTPKQHLFWEELTPLLKYMPYPTRTATRKIYEIIMKSRELRKIISI